MKRRLWIGLLTSLLVGVLMADLASAQPLGGNLTINDSESSNVSVYVATKTMVDVNPAAFNWTADPGGVGDNNTETNEFYAIQIENIGSHNITHVWFNATYPSQSPFGVGSTANTDSGNYVVLSAPTQNSSLISNQTAFAISLHETYRFINRVEYNNTRALVYVTDPEGSLPPDNNRWWYGRFRNASTEYFWMVNVTDGSCEDNAFYIGDAPHTKTKTGSVDFRNCVGTLADGPPVGPGVTDCSVGTFTNNSVVNGGPSATKYGYAEVNISGEHYCVVIANCSRMFFTHWNKDFPFNLCNSPYSEYAWNSTVDGPLTPGDSFVMGIKVRVPYGIYEGTSNKGYITAIVNDV
ncbi:MAG: hypothetical protein B6U97_02205 [Candidatus Altiarchaeales archaeon ex4484_96]|nr:MAG: hypothetical protein B6U97_02205 [Candidatus Altiarchaeales archaeon ex4484_96]